MTGHPPVRVAVVCAIDLSVRALLKPQIEALSAAGYQVDAVCSDGPEVQALRRQGLSIRTVEILRSLSPLRDLRSLINLTRLFMRQRYRVVHTHTPKAAFLAQIAAVLAGVPVRINTLHGLYYHAFAGGWQRIFHRCMELLTCRLCHYVFSQSQEDVDTLLRRRAMPASRLVWLGNGIDLERFSRRAFAADEAARVRHEFDLPANAFVVGIVARMVNEKGIRELLEAIARLRRLVPHLHLLHIGFIDRSRSDEVTPDLADRLGIADICRFAGQRTDIARLMTAMDMFVLPSYREGYPRSVMEANAMGLPAVVTDIRGCREAVIDGVNGLLVPPRQVQPLVDAIQRIHAEPELRRRMAAAARRRAEETFDERKVIEKILAAYRRLLPDGA